MSFIPLSDLNSAVPGTSKHEANDCWGWTDTVTKEEYAIIGVESGTAYVDITDPVNPIYIGKLPSHSGRSFWGDMKTYKNYAYILSEHVEQGMQILDLSQLKNVNPGSRLAETGHYNKFGNAHNIFINEDSGYAYVVGSSECQGGLYMINLSDPANPVFAGCFSDDGYTHDVQCVMYNGSDDRYTGREICFAENEDTVTIVDVTDKSNPIQLSRASYSNMIYTHQGWLTENHDYLLVGDELDEKTLGIKTTTYVLNVKNLEDPKIAGPHVHETDAIDHNMYVKGGYVYQANYRAGLRILDLKDISQGRLNEVAFFDIYPNSDSAQFNGAWSVYPFFESGSIIVSGIEQGLYVVRATATNPTAPTPTPPTPTPPTPTVPTPTNPPPGCDIGEDLMEITIQPDKRPKQITWKLINNCDGEVLLNEGPYLNRQEQKVEKCVPVDQEYKFVITDSKGDGICCNKGDGNYKIEFNGDVYNGDGVFEAEDTVVFGSCGDSTPAPTPSGTSFGSNSTWYFEEVFSENFDRGLGQFKKSRGTSVKYSKNKKWVMLSAKGYITSKPFDVSEFSELMVKFNFRSGILQRKEGFALEYCLNTNKCKAWTVVKEWTRNEIFDSYGEDVVFSPNIWLEDDEYIILPANAISAQIRLKMRGSNRRDKLIIDEVEVYGMGVNATAAA